MRPEQTQTSLLKEMHIFNSKFVIYREVGPSLEEIDGLREVFDVPVSVQEVMKDLVGKHDGRFVSGEKIVEKEFQQIRSYRLPEVSADVSLRAERY